MSTPDPTPGAPTYAPVRTARTARGAWCLIVLLMGLGLALECWGFSRDLPYADTDEPVFVRPAVHMASTGDLDPHWFGHPGSTVIYPLALYFHLEDVVVHGGPIFSGDAAVSRRFAASPRRFYLAGRLWVLAFAIGAIPLLFLIGRRAFGTRAGLIAALWWVVLPLIIRYGRIVRTDSAGVFFTLLSLLIILRILERSTVRYNVLAGVAIGLAISSRYFLVTLVPVLVLANVMEARRDGRPKCLSRIVVGVGAAFVGFLVTTPYFMFDLHTAVRSITLENAHLIGHEGLSPPGNLGWYLFVALPGAISWPLIGLVAAGVVVVLRRRNPRQLLLMAFVALFLVVVSLGRLHWDRWIIPILGILLLVAAHALVSAFSAVDRNRVHRNLVALGLVVAAVLLAAIPGQAVVNLDRRSARPSTRVLARRWVDRNVPEDARIAEEVKTVPLWQLANRHLYRHSLAFEHTLAQYRRSGYTYLFTNRSLEQTYRQDANAYSAEIAFYRDLARQGSRVAVFRPNDRRGGPSIDIWKTGSFAPMEGWRNPG